MYLGELWSSDRLRITKRGVRGVAPIARSRWSRANFDSRSTKMAALPGDNLVLYLLPTSMERSVQDRDPNIVESSLSRSLTVHGVTVEVRIYRLETDPQWALEVVNDAGTSTVWDTQFDTDDEAFVAFQLVVEEEGIETFLDSDNVIQFPTRH